MKIARWIVVITGLWLCMSCGESQEQDDPFYTETALEERGPHTVGFQRTTVSYTPPGADTARTLPVLVWYPGISTPDARRADFTLLGTVPIRKARAFKNLALDASKPRPLAVYSHGSGGEGVLAYPYAERLASRGWVVAAVDHVGNTTKDTLGSDGVHEMASSVYRPLDISTVIDAAENGFELEGFASEIDTERTFLFGHSFGGFTAMLIGGAGYDLEKAQARACDQGADAAPCTFLAQEAVQQAIARGFKDTRVQAIALQAPSMMGILKPEGVDVPTLLLTGDRDQTTTHQNASVPIWEGLDDPRDLWVRFADAGHFSFITVCDIFGAGAIAAFEPSAPEDGCGPTFLPPSDVATLNAWYLSVFAEYYIQGASAWAPFVRGEQQFRIQGDAEILFETH